MFEKIKEWKERRRKFAYWKKHVFQTAVITPLINRGYYIDPEWVDEVERTEYKRIVTLNGDPTDGLVLYNGYLLTLFHKGHSVTYTPIKEPIPDLTTMLLDREIDAFVTTIPDKGTKISAMDAGWLASKHVSYHTTPLGALGTLLRIHLTTVTGYDFKVVIKSINANHPPLVVLDVIQPSGDTLREGLVFQLQEWDKQLYITEAYAEWVIAYEKWMDEVELLRSTIEASRLLARPENRLCELNNETIS